MTCYTVGDDVNTSNVPDLTEDSNVVDDLSIVPLEKDGFVLCEFCGRVGRRTHFCFRDNKFCSLECQKSSVRRRHKYIWKYRLMESEEHMEGMIPLEPLPQLQQWQAAFNNYQAGPIRHPASQVANSYEWKDELFGCDFLAAPVSLFKHAPLHEMWDSTFEGMKVEVKNTDLEDYSEKLSCYFWVATVLKVKGYMGLLRYEGFGSDNSKDFWVNLCCSEVHPVGWCATRGKPLIPPKSIEDKYTDWKKFLVKQLTGARTLPANFYTKLNDSLSSRFIIGSVMEVVDKNRISQVKVASVCEIIGKRLHVKYYDSSPEDNGFWCHEDSPLIHPVGWAFRIGHPLDAPATYCQRIAAGRLIPNDSTPDMFYKYPTNEPPVFSEGMKLEAIDPLNLSSICAATVMQILCEGYMMIRIDCYPADASGADWFCYHQRSPCIFPVGFALANNVAIVPPNGLTAEEFSWETYLAVTGSHAAPRSLFSARGHVVSHGFVAGMRLECADLMDPRLVCVATVARVVADLLKVHFDGWGTEYDQWLWAHSTDVYPVGWCRAVGHRLEGPLQPAPRAPRRLPPRPPRRRRRTTAPKAVPQPNTTEDSSQNSDMGDAKRFSPHTSSSEVSPEGEARPEADAVNMEVDDVTNGEEEGRNAEEMNRAVEEVKSRLMEVERLLQEKRLDVLTESHSTPLEADPPESIDSNSQDTSQDISEDINQHTNEDISQDASDIIINQDASQHINEDINQHVSPQTTRDQPPVCSVIPEQRNEKVIPRLVNTIVPLEVFNSVDPENWTAADVAKFLTVNDCQPYCDNFSHITGPVLLQLSKDEIIEILEMKVGPSLKIYDLIQQLKCKIKQPQCRMLGTFK